MLKKELKTVPVADRMWLMAQLRDSLKLNDSPTSGDALLPVGNIGKPSPERIKQIAAQMPQNTAVVIHTSGSSGTPKAVALSADAINASAVATNEYLGGVGQWLVTLPIHLISGLQMLTRSILAETAPVFYDGKFTPKNFIKLAQKLDHERKYTSLVPVQLAKLLEYAEEDPKALSVLQSFDRILVGGQAMPTHLRQKAYDLEVSITRTYGMTETAGGAVYDGVEIGDTKMRIRNGEVQLAGTSLALGYIGDDALTAEKFVTEDETTWFRTGDAGNLLGGMLRITGRIDRVIVSGGVNVSLDAIETIANNTPGYQNTVAVGIPDDEWGTTVVTVTETTEAAETTATAGLKKVPQENYRDLQEAVTQKLGKAASPKLHFKHGNLPRLTGGKPDFRAVRAEILAQLNSTS